MLGVIEPEPLPLVPLLPVTTSVTDTGVTCGGRSYLKC